MLKSVEDYIGIEIELERSEQGSPWPRIRGWDRTDDGSLRNGTEYVLSGATKGAGLLDAINAASRTLSKIKELQISSRCSTHIHCDIRDLDDRSLDKFIDLLFFFEKDLVNTNKVYDRSKSNFCYTSELSKLSDFLKLSSYELKHRARYWPKYTAINLQPMSSLGTIEFRGSEALIRKGELLRAVNRILILKNLARTNTERWDLLAWVANTHPREIFKSSFRKSHKFSDPLENYIRVIELREGI